MKKQYSEPEMTTVAFDTLDIIATSYGDPHDNTKDYTEVWGVEAVE